jgi:hypothetical protein
VDAGIHPRTNPRAAHAISPDAWTPALVLMAFAEVLGRLAVLQVRARRLTHTPEIAAAIA